MTLPPIDKLYEEASLSGEDLLGANLKGFPVEMTPIRDVQIVICGNRYEETEQKIRDLCDRVRTVHTYKAEFDSTIVVAALERYAVWWEERKE